MHRGKKRAARFERSCAVCGRAAASLLGGGDDLGHVLQCNIPVEAGSGSLAYGPQRCGHFFCPSCLRPRFDGAAAAFPCPAPGCGQQVRKKTLGAESLEEFDARRYRDKRARVLKVRNRLALEAFGGSQEALDAYQAETEDLVGRLLFPPTPEALAAAEKELADYARAHAEEIEREEPRNASRRAEEVQRLKLEAAQLKERAARFEAEDAEALTQPRLTTTLAGTAAAARWAASGRGLLAGHASSLAAAGLQGSGHDLSLAQPKPLRIKALAVTLSAKLGPKGAAIRSRAGGAPWEAARARARALAVSGFG